MESIYLEYVNETDLYESYMPFFRQGGLFFRTDEEYNIGEEISLHVILPDCLEASDVKAKVSWITPFDAQNGKDAGVGVSFIEDVSNIRQKIERSIDLFLNSSEPTLSM